MTTSKVKPSITASKSARTLWLPKVRVSPEELDTIKARAEQAGLSLSEYQRRMCLSGKVSVTRKKDNVLLVRELKSIGNNLNQLARSVHIHGVKMLDHRQLDLGLGQLTHVLDGMIHDR